MRRRLSSRARVLAVTLLTGLALTSCGGGGDDAARAAEEARTCASLRERVIGRALEDPGLFDHVAGPEPTDAKVDELGPAAFAADPAAWYAALEQALADADFGPSGAPSSVSAASRLIRTCQELGS